MDCAKPRFVICALFCTLALPAALVALSTFCLYGISVAAELEIPDTTEVVLQSDALRFGFRQTADRIEWSALQDKSADREMLAPGARLWKVVVEDTGGTRHELDNESRWQQVGVFQSGGDLRLTWGNPREPAIPDFQVRCRFRIEDAKCSATLEIDNGSSATIRNVVFPQIALQPFGGDGSDDATIFPRAIGERRVDPFSNGLDYSGPYPGGWSTVQFLAHYDPKGGLYIGAHDPLGSTKQILARTQGDGKSLLLAYDWAAADASISGNDFTMPGPAVFQRFDGDWFDAAQIYRDWARREARWWPEDPDRSDTPRWMHEIAVWALANGTTQSVVGHVSEFAEYMGVPTALHWYNWHAIPFDDDYPHYFPPKPDFAEGVAALQKAGVRVMPYINGRLWDTDLEDFATTAHRFATKNEKGEPLTEEYGSGQKLAAMCPVTDAWQRTVRRIVLGLVDDCGVDGVYIDQIAAARPRLCFDASHGHPLGGGHWWTEDGYWPLLRKIHDEFAARGLDEKMLTTECNAEPYIHLLDAYLTWHYQYEGMVPVFPAIYGGRLQFFGRAYRGGPTQHLALRMKAAQSLVWGEQIGWISPGIIHHETDGPFVRRMARLRYALRDYLADGTMARPPKLRGDIPTVTADWKWRDDWPVTDTAIQSGTWKAGDGRVVLLFVNVLEKPLSVELDFDGSQYGLEGDSLQLTSRTEEGAGEPETVPRTFRRKIELPAYGAVALELRGAP